MDTGHEVVAVVGRERRRRTHRRRVEVPVLVEVTLVDPIAVVVAPVTELHRAGANVPVPVVAVEAVRRVGVRTATRVARGLDLPSATAARVCCCCCVAAAQARPPTHTPRTCDPLGSWL